MRYGFTGSRVINPQKLVDACRVLDALADGKEFTTGACVGWDAWIGRHLANQFPNAVHRIVVPFNHDLVDPEVYDWATEVIEMPEGTNYRDRNNKILDYTDLLYAFITGSLNPRSGTSMTINLASNRNIKRIPVLV